MTTPNPTESGVEGLELGAVVEGRQRLEVQESVEMHDPEAPRPALDAARNEALAGPRGVAEDDLLAVLEPGEVAVLPLGSE